MPREVAPRTRSPSVVGFFANPSTPATMSRSPSTPKLRWRVAPGARSLSQWKAAKTWRDFNSTTWFGGTAFIVTRRPEVGLDQAPFLDMEMGGPEGEQEEPLLDPAGEEAAGRLRPGGAVRFQYGLSAVYQAGGWGASGSRANCASTRPGRASGSHGPVQGVRLGTGPDQEDVERKQCHRISKSGALHTPSGTNVTAMC